MVLDVCATLPAPPEVLRTAVDRTAAWAERAHRRHRDLDRRPADQALFGIVQGGIDPDLREESAVRTVEIGFDGYGIGACRWGSRVQPCWRRWPPPCPTFPRTGPGT